MDRLFKKKQFEVTAASAEEETVRKVQSVIAELDDIYGKGKVDDALHALLTPHEVDEGEEFTHPVLADLRERVGALHDSNFVTGKLRELYEDRKAEAGNEATTTKSAP